MSIEPDRLRRFSSETERVRVAGTQARQDAVWRVVGPPVPEEDDRPHWHGEAELLPEPSNPYDPSAVRVEVEGEMVGYVPRELAARVQPAVSVLAARGERVVVPAYALGGFRWPEGGRASVGLVLRLDPEELAAAA
jgi:hypothetical protein